MRKSIVDSIFCQTVEFSAALQIGDSVELNPYSAGMAVQKQVPVYFQDHAFNLPDLPKYLTERQIDVERTNKRAIKVNDISLNGLTGSSIMHVGSFKRGEALSQIVNIRILTEK